MKEYDEEKYIVYCHTNKINNKKYIGQTYRSLETRSGSNGCGYKECPYFYRAIQKHKWDNFKHEVLFENLSKESADRIEKILIQIFRTQNPDYGYNIQNGGTFGNVAPTNDLTGKQFGRLTVISRDFSNDKEVRWLCQCSCGNPELISVSTHTLNRGYTQSCGCYRKEKAKQDSTIHGMTGTKIHNKWLSLIDRENVCDEWKYNFMNFYDWAMYHGYKDNLFLCRVELNEGFNPDNCVWMTKKEYIRKNQSKLYTYDGKTMTLPEWSEHYGINIRTLNNRINKYGMSIEEALTKPIKKKHYYTYNDETHSISEWAELYNLKTKTLECRLNRGKTIEEALNM